MLEALRIQALDYLYNQINSDDDKLPDDLDKWYRKIKKESPRKIFKYLVEASENVKQIYILEKKPEDEFITISIEEVRDEIKEYLPFVKSPSQGAQYGTLFKRTYNAQKKKYTPQPNRTKLTIKNFEKISNENKDWASYFAEISEILNTKNLKLPDGNIINCEDNGYRYCLDYIVNEIDGNKDTSFITVKDYADRLPGDVTEYIEYLTEEFITSKRYLTKKVKSQKDMTCPLCGGQDKIVYPNALSGSGVNLSNVDRSGRFPGMSVVNAWKGFSLCADCADLLYIYKNHTIKKGGPKNNTRPFTAPIAGETALIIPYCTNDPKTRFEIWDHVKDYIDEAKEYVDGPEEMILEILSESRGLFNLTFLWCEIGQSIDKVSGVITDVPPSRLKYLSEFNDDAEDWKHPIFPKKLLKNQKSKINLEVDLNLSAFRSLFFRPGGKKAPNATRRIAELKRQLAACVYHNRSFTPKNQKRLWDEILITAQWWWLEIIVKGDAYGLLNQGKGKKGKGDYLTPAGWIRHWAWWLYYLKQMGVIEMESQFYKPKWDELKPYFGPESGINTKQKAYAFLLGVLYGKLLNIQGARGVNVGANALTWLKRLRLRGADLPELYTKTREKLLAYDAEKNPNIKLLIGEIGELGISLGDPIELSQTQTNYYLLLGQSMTNKILKKEEK